jgi:cell division protein FtsW
MTPPLLRRSDTLLGRWWWTVDRASVFSLLALMMIGAVMVVASSPPVAARIKVPTYHFVTHQLLFLTVAGGMMFVISLLSNLQVRRLATLGFGISLLCVLWTLLFGAEVKGSTRWLYIAGLSLQPSEFLKPCFAVFAAWLFSGASGRFAPMQGGLISFSCYVLVCALLALQPDLGMLVTVSAIWWGQCVLAGLPITFLPVLMVLGAAGLFMAYTFLPHATKRIDSFLNPEQSDSFQVKKSLEAFQHGGFFGTGPGEGTVKRIIPDAHTDFVFAVVGEEFGAMAGLLVVGIFGFVVLRGLWRLRGEYDPFIALAVAGLLFQFGLQAAINMGVSLHLLPTKGMTLPFISYGGSSAFSLALAMGMLLALTRRRYGGAYG